MAKNQTPEKNIEKIMAILGPLFPDRRSLLNHENPFQLLVATVLAAQCTDAAVNLATPELFRHFPDPPALAEAPLKEVETIVHPLGFFRAKAHNIKALSKQLNDKFNSAVPKTMDELLTLPGVGRKTASVILSTCFNEPAIIVDTHFSRICQRLGFTSSERPEIIERDIAAIAPKEEWTAVSLVFNRFGRAICHARKPECEKCPIREFCSYIAPNPVQKPKKPRQK